MKNTYKILTLLVLFCLLAISSDVVAQCPMCKTAVESGLKEGKSTGRGLNDGILYLLAMPYVFAGTIGFFWYRAYRKKRAA